MDVDDNGMLNGLVDGLALLNALFVGGAPAIPAPFPDCGIDPTGTPLDCQTYDCSSTPNDPTDPNLALRIEGASGGVGGVAEIRCILDNSGDQGLNLFSWSVCESAAGVELVEVLVGTTLATVSDGDPPDFFAVNSFPGEGWTLGVVSSFFGDGPLAPGLDLELARATYELLEVGTYPLGFCDLVGDPPVVTLFTVSFGLQKVVPVTVAGFLEVNPGFLRGDANGDGAFDGLLDAIFLLEFQFLMGSAPPCFDAADADDDGMVNGVVDSLRILNFQFIPGSLPPPFPGPFACGGDPTLDELDCDDSSCP